MSLYSIDFIPWDAENIAEKALREGKRLSDLYEQEDFKKVLKLAEATGQDGKVFEILADLSRKYEQVLYNPECL